MTRSGPGNGVPRDTFKGDSDATPFLGFTSLDANFLYCPNQFLDICLPHHSRGCVRLVSYLFRKTLGWRDEFGRPLQQRIPVPYQHLIEHAGISRGAIRDAIDEAVKARYIRCTQEGRSHTSGKSAQSSSYELHWDKSSEYARTPTEFNGFFAGDGNRTPIPNDFFDVVVPLEPLALIRVVGAVIRKTIGYQDQFGGRRTAAPLSFTELQRRSNIADRKTISGAIRTAINQNFIVLVREGHFDPNGGEKNRPAAYGIRWAPSSDKSQTARPIVSSKTPPASMSPTVQKPHRPRQVIHRSVVQDKIVSIGSKFPPDIDLPIGSKTLPANAMVQNPHRQRSNNPTGNGSKTQLLEREFLKSTIKEQQQPTETQSTVAAADLISKLMEAGFESKAARLLVRQCSAEVIERQIAWIDRRTATRNRLGLLRQALLEDWTEPTSKAQSSSPSSSIDSAALSFAEGFYAGLGANKGKAIAEPSANDLAAATRFVSRAVEMMANSPESTGRSFSASVREWRGTSTGLNSLVASLRSFGDKFFARLEAQNGAALTARRTQESQARLAELKAAHQQYLVTTEASIRASRKTDYALFEKSRAKERQHLAQGNIGVKHLLAHHDSDAKRLEDFLSFFEKDVLGFNAWHASLKNLDVGMSTGA